MKRALGVVALVVLALLLWSVWDREALIGWMREARPVPFFALMALLPALGLPITPFFILAGATFGARIGLLGSLLALAANLTLCYWIAQSSLRPRLGALLRRFDYELPSFEEGGQSAVRFTLMVKVAPGVPGFVKHYGLGAAGVPFSVYFVASMAITGLYAAALIVLGESLLEHDLGKAVAAAVALAAVAGAFWWLRRRRMRDGRGT